MVAKGFAQKPGIDYTETYAPVAHMESTRVLLHIGAPLDWEIHQMDVKTAFLHGDLKEEVYMDQPEGMKETRQRRLGMLHVQDSVWPYASCMGLENFSTSCYVGDRVCVHQH